MRGLLTKILNVISILICLSSLFRLFSGGYGAQTGTAKHYLWIALAVAAFGYLIWYCVCEIWWEKYINDKNKQHK